MQCALCKKEAKLEESHVIPKFVFKSMKKNSPTGNMRIANEPNKKIQDGDKLYLLCGECEDLFNKDETLFANNIYHNFQQEKLKVFEYGEWLERFIVSVNWRTLYLDILGFIEQRNVSQKQLDYLMMCEEKMRKYLLGSNESLNPIENHIFFFRKIEIASREVAEMNLHSSVGGSITGYTIISDLHNSAYIFMNLQGLIIVTILKRADEEEWTETLVNKQGSFNLEQPQVMNSPVSSELMYLSYQYGESKVKLNENQREKIIEAVMKNKEKFLQSKSYRRLQYDKELKEKE